MNLKLIVARLVMAAVPACAQAQPPSAAKVTKADVQKVLKIISGDKAKTQTYCDITKLGKQFAEADEKKADELNQKIDELEKKLGPEYVALMNGFQDIDSQSEVGREIGSMFTALDNLCGG
jgi:ABC-type transporter MlaC component